MNELKSAYISSTGSFLPGEPVQNDDIEEYLGLVNGKSSEFKRLVLRMNKIKTRYYAITPKGDITHLTEDLAALAIEDAISNSDVSYDKISFLSTGTTFPDLIAPGFASMVHGRLGGHPLEIVSCGGICGSGISALKAAFNAVRTGEHEHAISVSAERLSRILLGKRFDNIPQTKRKTDQEEDGFYYFNGEFLRWMLSDGAGAFLISNSPAKNQISLKIEWIDVRSFANELPLCMFMGTETIEKFGPGKTWLDDSSDEDKLQKHLILRQDQELLTKHHATAFERHIEELHESGRFVDKEVDWYLPHMSSYFFEDRIMKGMKDRNVHIPKEKWFSNLSSKGNTGSAAIYIALDELLQSGKIEKGQKILCFIPESGRFLSSFMLLTAE